MDLSTALLIGFYSLILVGISIGKMVGYHKIDLLIRKMTNKETD